MFLQQFGQLAGLSLEQAEKELIRSTLKMTGGSREQAASRRLQVGTGDRSERIRTYNFPQGRLTDHRIELTLYKLEDIVNGDLDDVLAPLAREFEAEQLAELE